MKQFSDLELAIAALPDEDFLVLVDSTKRRRIEDVPAELGKLYETWGILSVEVKESSWPRPKELEVAPAWRFQFGFSVFPPEGPQRSFARRAGVRWSFVLTSSGVGTHEDGGAVEEESVDAVECILREIENLRRGVERIRQESRSAERLVAAGRAASWTGPSIGHLVDSLTQRPAEELAPHVREIVDALLAGGQFSMGVLDILAAAGPEAFRTVAESVYAHEEDRPYVVQLLGKVGDVSPEAIQRYRAAFESEEDDEISEAFEAVKAVASQPAARALVPVLRERLPEWETGQQADAIALLGQLGEPLLPLVEAALEHFDGSDLRALCDGISGLDTSAITPALLTKLRALDPANRGTLEAIEGLVGLGIEDRPWMEAALREHFVPRGGRWQSRAEAVLQRWTR